MTKNYLAFSSLLLLSISCTTTVQLVGNQEMISNSEIKSTEGYTLVRKIENTSTKQIKELADGNSFVEEAVGKAVNDSLNSQSCFIKNAKIYMVARDGWSKTYYTFYVEGEVWTKTK